MSRSTVGLDEALLAHVRDFALAREDELLARLRNETAAHELARMQISVEQGRLMAVLTQLMGARNAIEVGVFTGYSALCVARALPVDGTLVACDISDEYTSVARRYWAEAGLADRIDLRIGPASATLDGLIAAGRTGAFDLAFIDADKTGYAGYYEQCLELLKPGGAILFDNMFWGGSVIDPAPDDTDGRALAALTQQIADDERVDPALVPIGDGVLIARKR